MNVLVGRNRCDILGYDKNENVFQLKYAEENEYYVEKYVNQGGSILWEENPPQCSKCCKTKNTSCNKECYNFIIAKNMNKLIQKHNSLSNTRSVTIQAENKKIKDMKKEGAEYVSWLHKSLFESKDNTERMVFV